MKTSLSELLHDYFKKSLEHDLKKRQDARIPGVFVPDALKIIRALTDKDGNVVCRAVCYKPQIEDALKACRRAGYTAKEFVYDIE